MCVYRRYVRALLSMKRFLQIPMGAKNGCRYALAKTTYAVRQYAVAHDSNSGSESPADYIVPNHRMGEFDGTSGSDSLRRAVNIKRSWASVGSKSTFG